MLCCAVLHSALLRSAQVYRILHVTINLQFIPDKAVILVVAGLIITAHDTVHEVREHVMRCYTPSDPCKCSGLVARCSRSLYT